MGMYGSVRSALVRSHHGFVDFPLEDGETLVLDVCGCLIKHRADWKRGQLRLTDQRLLIRPWNTGDLGAIVRYGLPRSETTSEAAVVGLRQRPNGLDVAAPNAIAHASRGGEPTLLRAPTIVLTMADGREMEIGVFATPTATNATPGNTAARERLLADLQSF